MRARYAFPWSHDTRAASPELHTVTTPIGHTTTTTHDRAPGGCWPLATHEGAPTATTGHTPPTTARGLGIPPPSGGLWPRLGPGAYTLTQKRPGARPRAECGGGLA